MGICNWRISAGLLLLAAATLSAQQARLTADSVTIVQPGAPGQNGKVLTPATARTTLRGPSEADISFMQGMIMHHSQAIEMVDLLRTKGRDKALQELGNRMRISQTDEMNYMKQWLEDRSQPTSKPGSNMAGMKGMDHSSMPGMKMASMPMMPGMLTPEQMQAAQDAREDLDVLRDATTQPAPDEQPKENNPVVADAQSKPPTTQKSPTDLLAMDPQLSAALLVLRLENLGAHLN